MACLAEGLDELLSFLNCPQAPWKKVRTTNAIEGAFREVRRRTPPQSEFALPPFPNVVRKLLTP